VTQNPYEVLHLSIEVMREGVMYRKEFSYMSTHEVFTRTSRMTPDSEEDGWDVGVGWVQLRGPGGLPVMIRTLESLNVLAQVARQKGWEVTLHPLHNEALEEFTHECTF